MKLSLQPMLGAVQVRGGRLLEVAHDHRVSTGTANMMAPAKDDKGRPAAKPFNSKWVNAKVGDLAMELVVVKTGRVLGVTYLSGDALQLNLYSNDLPPFWFTEAIGWSVFRPPFPAATEGHESRMLRAVERCKRSQARLVAFVLEVATDKPEELYRAHEWFWHAFAQLSDREAEHTQIAHVMGFFQTKKKHKGPVALFHSQPPRDVDKYCASGFQIDLVNTSPNLIAKDVLSDDFGGPVDEQLVLGTVS